MTVLRWQSPNVEIWHGDARAVAAQQEPGSFSLAILDGPYGMNKAAWDRMGVAGLPDWYAPHIDDVDRLCAPSATLYLWNTAEGWATLHPGIVARGWRLFLPVIWHKIGSKADNGAFHADATEVCGWYVRETYRARCAELRAQTGLTLEQLGRGLGCSPRLVQQWERPADALGGPCRPTHSRLTHLATIAGYDVASAHREYLRHTVRRRAFGVSNVWSNPAAGGKERLRQGGGVVHPCQKPLAFADRMIRASSRPGERVWAPFGGTCREAVAVETMARKDPAEARYCVTADIDEDGRGYLDAVCRVLDGGGVASEDKRQTSMFGGDR